MTSPSKKYRKFVNIYPLNLSDDPKTRKLLWNALRGLAHGISGRNAIAGMTDIKFESNEKVRWHFPDAQRAYQFHELGIALLKGAGCSGAVKRVLK